MDGCIFCRIVGKAIPATVLYEDDLVLAFLDISPLNPGHSLVIPKQHFFAVSELPEAVAGRVMAVAARLGAALMRAAAADGFNLILSNGAAAGQVVGHTHLHVVPRFPTDGLHLPARAVPYASAEEREELAAKVRQRLASGGAESA